MRGILFNYELGMFDAVIEGRKTETRRLRPTYKKGEVLFLKEPYSITISFKKELVLYKYQKGAHGNWKWKNKMFMPANLARHFIEIVDVRQEPLMWSTIKRPYYRKRTIG